MSRCLLLFIYFKPAFNKSTVKVVTQTKKNTSRKKYCKQHTTFILLFIRKM